MTTLSVIVLLSLAAFIHTLLSSHLTSIPPNRYAAFYSEVVRRNARLVAQWQCYGFVHGVMNTDNLSLAGLTIDYGPFGFMDAYNPHYVPNYSDTDERYSYENQPKMMHWGLARLADVCVPFSAYFVVFSLSLCLPGRICFM